MATYVIGDIQGCAAPFKALLDKVQFSPGSDQLWLAGDLVNRGPGNLEVLRTVKALGRSAIAVLGNHDLHLLGMAGGVRKIGRKDTCEDVLNAPDREELLDWLRHCPLLHRTDDYVLTHAGVPHIWTVDQAQEHAAEVESALRGPFYEQLLRNMYGNRPVQWHPEMDTADRWRTTVNYLTRMRFIADDGTLDFKAKEGAGYPPPGMHPWFEYPRHAQDSRYTFLFGHWAALEGQTSMPQRIALDTGCIWGGCLSALRLEDRRYFRLDCSSYKL